MKYQNRFVVSRTNGFKEDEEDRFVGKAIVIAINYMKKKGLDKGKEDDIEKLYELGRRLLGKKETLMYSKEKPIIKPKPSKIGIDYNEVSLCHFFRISPFIGCFMRQ